MQGKACVQACGGPALQKVLGSRCSEGVGQREPGRCGPVGGASGNYKLGSERNRLRLRKITLAEV